MRDISKSLVRRAYTAFLSSLEDKPNSLLDSLLGSDKPKLPEAKGMMAKKQSSAKPPSSDKKTEKQEYLQYAIRLRELRLARKAAMGMGADATSKK